MPKKRKIVKIKKISMKMESVDKFLVILKAMTRIEKVNVDLSELLIDLINIQADGVRIFSHILDSKKDPNLVKLIEVLVNLSNTNDIEGKSVTVTELIELIVKNPDITEVIKDCPDNAKDIIKKLVETLVNLSNTTKDEQGEIATITELTNTEVTKLIIEKPDILDTIGKIAKVIDSNEHMYSS